MIRYGWFEYHKTAPDITNYLTNQKLTVISGYTYIPNLQLECVYSDPEFEQKNIRISIFRQACFAGGRIELDYVDVFPEPPNYSRWRRIDDFLTDALFCWPDFLFYDANASLLVKGGWRNGQWDTKLKRLFSGLRSVSLEKMNESTIAEPFVYPLSDSPPKQWRYSDIEHPAANAQLKFERNSPLFIPLLDSSATISGFQGLVPYLERDDKLAYIFPAKLEPDSHRGEDPTAIVWYTYIDEDVFFTFRSTSSSPCHRLQLFYCKDYGFRRFPPEKTFWSSDVMGKPIQGNTPRNPEDIHSCSTYLSYPVWLTLVNSIKDAWPMWRIPRRKIELDPSIVLPANYGRSAYVGDYGPSIRYGFNAGMRNIDFQLEFLNN